MTLQNQVFKSLDALLPLTTETIVVAASGGADSMALVLLSNEYATAKGLKIIAATIDHNLRFESADEAVFVHKILNGQGIEHQTLTWNHEKDLKRLHERARVARYQLLLDFCRNYPNVALLTAHHKQDQVETILMRFLHGSGAAGFKGIQPIRWQDSVVIVRPMLEVDPKTLRDYLRAQNIAWVEDPSNANPKYERTRVRQLLQQIASDWGTDGILESATKISETQNTLEEVVRVYEEKFMVIELRASGQESFMDSPNNPLVKHEKEEHWKKATPPHQFPYGLTIGSNTQYYITINQTEFFKCPVQIQRQWLRDKIWQIGGRLYPKPYKTINAILKMLKQPKVNGYKVAGCIINVAKKMIYLNKTTDNKR